MVPAGRLQDKRRPAPRRLRGRHPHRRSASWSRASRRPAAVWPAVIGFGLLGGAGFGLGYSCANARRGEVVPAREEGAHHRHRGRRLRHRAGLHRAALEVPARRRYGVAGAFRTLGFAFLVVATAFAQFIRNPRSPPSRSKAAVPGAAAKVEATWRDMLEEPDVLHALGAVRLRRHRRPHDHRPHGEDRGRAVGQRHQGRLRLRRAPRDLQRERPDHRRRHLRPHRSRRDPRHRLHRAGGSRCSSSRSSRRSAASSSARRWSGFSYGACLSHLPGRHRRPVGHEEHGDELRHPLHRRGASAASSARSSPARSPTRPARTSAPTTSPASS